VQLAGEHYRDLAKRLAFMNAVLDRMRAVPGVTAAGAGTLPLIDSARSGFRSEGSQVLLPAEWPRTTMITASPGYRESAGLRLLQGRFFSEPDYGQPSRRVVINDVLARQYFPDTEPVGKRVQVVGQPGDQWAEIIGVVSGIVEIDVARGIGPQIYWLFTPNARFRFSFIVRTSGNSATLHSTLTRQIHAVDPDLPVTVRTLAERLAESEAKSTFQFHLLAGFALVALLIASVGLYGVIAYTVSQRTTEIGIRMALGAVSSDIAELVMRLGGRLVMVGVALGIMGALGCGRLIEAGLYQVSASDPITLAGIALLFAAIAALACWLPARRATKVDPIVALRVE
jgi:putative ABC transport system permease protein